MYLEELKTSEDRLSLRMCGPSREPPAVLSGAHLYRFGDPWYSEAELRTCVSKEGQSMAALERGGGTKPEPPRHRLVGKQPPPPGNDAGRGRRDTARR